MWGATRRRPRSMGCNEFDLYSPNEWNYSMWWWNPGVPFAAWGCFTPKTICKNSIPISIKRGRRRTMRMGWCKRCNEGVTHLANGILIPSNGNNGTRMSLFYRECWRRPGCLVPNGWKRGRMKRGRAMGILAFRGGRFLALIVMCLLGREGRLWRRWDWGMAQSINDNLVFNYKPSY